MTAPIIPADEFHRLDALYSLDLLDSPSEDAFDDIVELGRLLFGVPICLVSLIDSDRQWFKAAAGLEVKETNRCDSFCGHAILGKDVFAILDATQDERFHDNPLVTGGPRIRFYAGAPLWMPYGYPIGTLCIISHDARVDFSHTEAKKLSSLAGMVMNAIAVRALRKELDKARAKAGGYWMTIQKIALPVALLDAKGRIDECNKAFAALCPTHPTRGKSVSEVFAMAHEAWSPNMMNAFHRDEFTIPQSVTGTELSVYRRAGGFVLTASNAKSVNHQAS